MLIPRHARLGAALVIVIIVAAFAARAAHAAPGALDPSFGTGGILSTPGSEYTIQTGSAIASFPDGGFATVLPGASVAQRCPVGAFCPDILPGTGREVETFVVRRYTETGAADASFTGGTATITPKVTGFTIKDAVATPDGGLLVALLGYTGPSLAIDVLRVLPDGTLDPAFATGGQLVSPIESPRPSPIFIGPSIPAIDLTFEAPLIVAVQLAVAADGSFALLHSPLQAKGSEPVLVDRYTSAGASETTFGDKGRVSVTSGTLGGLQGHQRVIAFDAAGDLYASLATRSGNRMTSTLERLTPNGTVDTTFGQGGVIGLPLPGEHPAAVAQIALDTQGRVVALVDATSGPASDRTFTHGLTRILPSGAIDPSFASGAVVTISSAKQSDPGMSTGLAVGTLALDASGRPYVFGVLPDTEDNSTVVAPDRGAVERFTVDGALDGGFDTGGVATADLADHPGTFVSVTGGVVDTSGRIDVLALVDRLSTSSVTVTSDAVRWSGGDPVLQQAPVVIAAVGSCAAATNGCAVASGRAASVTVGATTGGAPAAGLIVDASLLRRVGQRWYFTAGLSATTSSAGGATVTVPASDLTSGVWAIKLRAPSTASTLRSAPELVSFLVGPPSTANAIPSVLDMTRIVTSLANYADDCGSLADCAQSVPGLSGRLTARSAHLAPGAVALVRSGPGVSSSSPSEADPFEQIEPLDGSGFEFATNSVFGGDADPPRITIVGRVADRSVDLLIRTKVAFASSKLTCAGSPHAVHTFCPEGHPPVLPDWLLFSAE